MSTWLSFFINLHHYTGITVKPSPKRLNFYGQPAVFDHFVRNRHFWSKSFTDKRSIFIDVSVNGNDYFAKCSTC